MPYPENQRWALALAGVITELDSGHHESIGSWGDNEHTRPWCTNRLREFYGVESAADLVARVNALFQEEQGKEARETLASLPERPAEDDERASLVRANRAEIERAGLLAWDTARLVAVLGWGAWAGYAAELDAWNVMMVAASRVQQTYDSWASFGAAYELGRLYWSRGKTHAPTAAALEKLKTDPGSPWVTLAWGLELGVKCVAPRAAKPRFKRTVCPSCGAPKARPSITAYVYCDYCGSLSDYDFAKACEKPLERPGPVYEALVAKAKPDLDAALAGGDVDAFRALQRELFDGWIDACPNAVPPRAKDPAYRAKYAAYLAEGAIVTALDVGAKTHAAAVAKATGDLIVREVKPGTLRVDPGTFAPFVEAVFAQDDYLAVAHEAGGVYAMQPDGASGELQRRMAMSMFVQGWLPMLDETQAETLLSRARLKSEYIEADPPSAGAATCGGCGADVTILEGARRTVCEHCGRRLDVEAASVTCAGCGASLAPGEGVTSFACPHCNAAVQRVAMMAPAAAV